MPRVSRTAVEFQVDGKNYRAEFGHQHCTEDLDNPVWVPVYKNGQVVSYQRPVKIPIVEGNLKLRHITVCTLYREALEVGVGASRCSVKDIYDWKHGVKESYERALRSYGVTEATYPQEYGKFMGAFFTEMVKTNRPQQKSNKVPFDVVDALIKEGMKTPQEPAHAVLGRLRTQLLEAML